MKSFNYPLLLLSCLLFSVSGLLAQESAAPPVTLDLQKTSYKDLLQELERQTGYRFFYDTADLDTTKIDVKADHQPFTKVLNEAFTGTGLSFSVSRYRQVFITKGDAIHTDLP